MTNGYFTIMLSFVKMSSSSISLFPVLSRRGSYQIDKYKREKQNENRSSRKMGSVLEMRQKAYGNGLRFVSVEVSVAQDTWIG